MLANDEALPIKYQDHVLKGNWKGYRECHIKSDVLLIYKLENDELTLTLVRTGSHSDLF
jgi:mRNA interferase YafQ